MTPLDFARNLAASDDAADQALGVAIVTRGVTDDDPMTGRHPWPLNAQTVAGAAQYLDLAPTRELIAAALALAPTVSDAMLNKAARP
jgi:hypothetical protein